MEDNDTTTPPKPFVNWRRIRKWLLVAGILAALPGVVIVWFVGSALVAPAQQAIGPPPADFPAQTVRIPSDSGATVVGWFRAHPNSRGAVLLLHPLRGDRRSMLSRARLFYEHGYSTLLIDLQAHGESAGNDITLGGLEQHDVQAAVDYLQTTDPDQKIAVVGWSLGGASALYAAPDVDVLVLESVYPTVSEAVHNRIAARLGPLHHLLAPLLLCQLKPRLGFSPDELRPIDHLTNVHCPVLIASGDRDTSTTINETRRMHHAANPPKKLVIFNDAGHVDLFQHHPTQYEAEIVGFVDAALSTHAPNDARNVGSTR